MSNSDGSSGGVGGGSGGGHKKSHPIEKSLEVKSTISSSFPSKTQSKIEKSGSSKSGKRGAFTPTNFESSRTLNSPSTRSQTGSNSRVQAKSSTGKLGKVKERASGRSRQKRKIKTVMAQIVKQVRRGKRNQGKSKSAIEKSDKIRATKSKSGSTGKVVKSRSSGRAAPRKKKTSRSLQQLHVLEKSVFRSRLESQNTSTEPVPFQWLQTELGKTAKTKAGLGALERINSESSLVGKSIIYHDDVDRSSGLLATAAVPSDSEKFSDDDVDFISMEALAEEITHVEANDIFESGPFSW